MRGKQGWRVLRIDAPGSAGLQGIYTQRNSSGVVGVDLSELVADGHLKGEKHLSDMVHPSFWKVERLDLRHLLQILYREVGVGRRTYWEPVGKLDGGAGIHQSEVFFRQD